ncbi:pre-toxin TG domain-containing protein [Bacillus wiedmannii]|uniref:pre-toxin TG domain-containing protein n=1 Tax=Bacillus wiedmannii TaxID=1890302 RepID=UPI00211D3EC7|nr:pre-toxin TG domain-containing protein [Bacillus wiedmannii]
MSLNMYLGEVQSQTQSMNAVCTATIQGMEQAIQSIDAFAIDTVLQGQTYSSAKSFFVQTFRPLAQGIIYLCEELIRQNNAFPNDFQSQVASTDVIEQEIREQIQEINQSIANIEAIDVAMPMPGIDAIVAVLVAMRKKLEETLEHLYEFNYTSSSNYDTALQLAANIATGLAEVQSGKGFSPVSGTFSTQGLNMDWTTSIQAIEEDRKRQADNLLNGSPIEEGAIDGRPSSESEEKGFDGGKLARDIAGEISGEYDIKRAWDGVDPSTGEKLSGWERAGAGFMAVAGLTPFGKLAKVGKGVKMTANAVESVKTAEKATEGIKTAERVAEAKNIPGRGYHKEVYANKPVKVQDAVTKWDEFLGTGTHTNIHPRTGLEDADRIFSADGTRSIRFGSHEMNSKPSKFHYHEETWTYDPVNNVMNVDNTLVRVPYKK